jgi:hypothetical protein
MTPVVSCCPWIHGVVIIHLSQLMSHWSVADTTLLSLQALQIFTSTCEPSTIHPYGQTFYAKLAVAEIAKHGCERGIWIAYYNQ